MTRRILVINGNPDPSPERLSAGLASAYADGAKAAGHIADVLNIGDMKFSLLRQAKDFLAPPTDQAIVAARAAILEADHLVFIYPLWLGGPPALLKGFMEQVACGQFVLGTSAHGLPKGNLKGRSARMVVTMGMPALFYRIFFGAHGVKAFNRSILGIGGIRPVATTFFGGISAPPGRHPRLVERLRRMGRRAE